MLQFKSLFSRRFLMSVGGGLLLSAAFPSLGWAWAAWIGPGLILFSAMGERPARQFWLGFAGGAVHFLTSLYWLLNIPFRWHNFPLAPGGAWLALSLYCALYPAAWAWLCWGVAPKTKEGFFAWAGWKRLVWTAYAGVAWTGLEYVRGWLMSGFPWNDVAASQYRVLPLIQIASITGISGLTFLVVWTSVGLIGTALSLLRSANRQSLWANAGLPLLTVAAVASWGASRLMTPIPSSRTLRVAMIQPSIPQTLIWDPAADQARFRTVLDLSRQTLASKPQLMLWPESAVPELSLENQQAISGLLHEAHCWLAFCAGTAEPGPEGETQYFNSSFLCDPTGQLRGLYHKRRLVIFGEYVPLLRWFPFLKSLTSIGGEVTPGTKPVQFEIEHPTAKMSVLICFEDMFADEARDHTDPDTDFLINLTNDGWFGHGAEQWQQAASGIFRAVENGLPILRCTNDGLTCWADAHGRVKQIFKRNGSVYEAGSLEVEIPLDDAKQSRPTFYHRHGDWLADGCEALALGGVIMVAMRRKVS